MEPRRGNLHVHSILSDGSRSVEQIAGIAAACNLDFVGINDHHVKCTDSHYVGNVLLLRGTEYNTRHSHYLAYNSCGDWKHRQVDGAQVIKHVRDTGGIGIIAHPFEKGSPMIGRGRHYPWRNWDVEGFDGIELWNQTSQWREAARGVWRSLWLWLFRRYHPLFSGASAEAMAKWDELCQKGHVTGIAGSDLHAPLLKLFKFEYRLLDYPMLLSAVNNYVFTDDLSGDAQSDGDKVLAALKKGRCFFAFDYLDLGYGFDFYGHSADSQVGMGGVLDMANDVALEIVLPRQGEICIIRNGKTCSQSLGAKQTYAVTEPGVYRIEAKLMHKKQMIPWIYSNPIYIKKE